MTNVGLSSCRIHVKDDARYYADSFNWFALGFQQWGYTGEQSNKITFALSYPKAVLGIMVTTGDGIPQNPVDVTLSGATAVGYNSAGCKTYWLAYGIQQWGIKAASTYTWTYPLPLAVVYYADMMGYRKGSAGSEYGWIRSISLIAFETYIIDESAICFCIGIAQQWGVYTTGKRNVTITLPIATSVTYAVIAVARTTNSIGCTGSQNCQYVSNVTSKTFQAGSYDAGNGYAGFWWLSISKAQALPKAHRLKHCYIPTAIQLIFVPLYVGQIIELLVLAIHDVFSNVAPDHDSCAVVIQ